jgi:hypothetical protein
LFEITSVENYGVNLPAKYYTGLFPEAKTLFEEPTNVDAGMGKGVSNAKSNAVPKTKKVEEYSSLNDILDKLSRNDYDTKCLTEKEKEILESQK